MATASNAEIVGDYRVIQDKAHELGEGSYGKVYKAEHVSIKNQFAAAKKWTVYKEFLKSGDYEKEADLLMKTIPPHENIIKVYDFVKKEYVEKGVANVDMWLLMEYAPLGNLQEFAQEHELTVEEKVELMWQCARGVQHLHNCKPEAIAHRDVKPQNVVITGSVKNPTARLCDFGQGKEILKKSDTSSVTMRSVTGTPNYAAPEQQVIQDGQFAYDKSVDVYSLGVTFDALFEYSPGKAMVPRTLDGKGIGRAMWEFGQSMNAASSTFHVPSFSLNIDRPSDTPLQKAVKDIIKNMVQLKPSDRIPIGDVVTRLSELRVPKVKKVSEVKRTSAAERASTSSAESLEELNVKTQKTARVKERSLWRGIIRPFQFRHEKKEPKVEKGPKQGKVPKSEKVSKSKRVPTSSVERLLRLEGLSITSPQMVAVNERSVWLREGSSWVRLPDMPPEQPRDDACYCIVPDGIVVVGGKVDDTVSSVCHHFSLLTLCWTRLADMPTARYKAATVYEAGWVLVLGGRDKHGHKLAVCERLHIKDGVWSSAASMMEPLLWPLVAAASGKVFVLDRSNSAPRLMQQYDPHTDQFSEAPPPPQHVRDTSRACLVGGGDALYLLGGNKRLALQYSPTTRQWVQLQSQPSASYDEGCRGVVQDGKLLLCGGDSGSNDHNMVEEYDPRTQQWQTSGFTLPFSFCWGNSLVGVVHV